MIGALLSLCLVGLLVTTAAFVVVSRNLVHGVFWLGAMLALTAGAFVALGAPFLAGIQLILYTGGIMTLMLFGVMLTRREPDTTIPNPVGNRVPAFVTAALLLGVLLTGIWTTPELGVAAPAPVDPDPTSGALPMARLFLGPHLIAFEALSLLLLVGMIGAIVLVRRTDP